MRLEAQNPRKPEQLQMQRRILDSLQRLWERLRAVRHYLRVSGGMPELELAWCVSPASRLVFWLQSASPFTKTSKTQNPNPKPAISTTCAAGTYADANACKPCPTECKTCTSSTVCTWCASGYWKNGNSCGGWGWGFSLCSSWVVAGAACTWAGGFKPHYCACRPVLLHQEQGPARPKPGAVCCLESAAAAMAQVQAFPV
jgi:hypothetical protein